MTNIQKLEQIQAKIEGSRDADITLSEIKDYIEVLTAIEEQQEVDINFWHQYSDKLNIYEIY